MNQAILKVENLWKSFGGITAVSGYELELPKGAIWGLIGPNGAGKTTIFNLISGVLKPDRGKILFRNKDITYARPDIIASMGLTRTFQNLRLFPNLTVEENLKVAAHIHTSYSLIHTLFSLPLLYNEERKVTERVEAILELFGMQAQRKEVASSLPYGLQRKLDIARALMTNPEVLLLDEPSAGMNPQEAEELALIIKKVKKERNLTMIIVEHRMPFVMGLVDTVQVLDYGSVIAVGTPSEIQQNPKVIEAYLGAGDLIA